MGPDRLYDKAVDVAMLRILLWGGRQWHAYGVVVRDALDMLGWAGVQGSVQAGMYATLRAWKDRGYLEERKRYDASTIEVRLGDNINPKRMTGGLDPVRMDVDEIRELDHPSAMPRRVEFEPDAYLKARTREARKAGALLQCPSPWEYAARLRKV